MRKEDRVHPLSLTDLLEGKRKRLEEFLSVSEALYLDLVGRNVAELGRRLEQRQKIIHSIDEIDLQIKGCRPADLPGRKRIPDPSEALLGTLKDLLQRAADLDRKCLSRAESLRDETQKELASLRRGWNTARRYLQRPGFRPRFMDVRG